MLFLLLLVVLLQVSCFLCCCLWCSYCYCSSSIIDSSIFGVIVGVGTVVVIEVAVAAVPHILTSGVGNYFRPRATLSLYMCLAGLFSVKKPKLMLTFCPSRARCSPRAVCYPLLSYMHREFLENDFTRNSFFSSLRNVQKPTKK